MKICISQSEWVKIPRELRLKLRSQFRVGTSEPTNMINNTLISDGSSPKDLQAMHIGFLIDALQPYIQWAKEDLYDTLLKMAIDKCEMKDVQPLTMNEDAALKARLLILEGKIHELQSENAALKMVSIPNPPQHGRPPESAGREGNGGQAPQGSAQDGGFIAPRKRGRPPKAKNLL